MTADFIAFHASERPAALALINNGREITYAEFDRDLRKFTRALREFDLPRAARVGVSCGDVYFHWLMRLAFEQLGIVTASLPEAEDPSSQRVLRDFDLVLSEMPIRAESARLHHSITPAWLREILRGAGTDTEPAALKGPDDPLRMLFTSGTTGTPKKLLYSRRIHERSVAKSAWFSGLTRHSRYLLVIPFTVGSSYANATACIRSGATVVFDERASIWQTIESRAITHAALPPIVLQQLLDRLPEGFVKPASLTVLSFGAAVSRTLRARALAKLASEVCDMYGSNEAGYVSSRRYGCDTEFSCVWPGVEVEVVDDRDRALPPGEIGLVRVKTDCMVQGYLDEPEASARMFRNGWFYAGDMGILHGARRLQILGRSDELLNIGWHKISPDSLEDLVLGAAEVGDVGVCSVPNADGIDEIHIVVSDVRCSMEELSSRIAAAFGAAQLGKVYLWPANRIPRNANGKIQRDLLKRVVARGKA